uniref:DUF5742 domain-containing protein n=1 Tax=Mesocestoides corti TaxID=53468 RepID=A0A5K3F5T7_MESCO
MGRKSDIPLPDDLTNFFQQLRSSHCSAKWDWIKLLETLQSGSRHSSVFWGICESGVFHLLYSKVANKESSITCKKLHTSDVSQFQVAGVCFSRLALNGIAAKRIDAFQEFLVQITSSLLEALLKIFELSNFPAATLQSLRTCETTKLHSLPRLISLDNGDLCVKNALDLALCRIHLLSSSLRSIFESGCTMTLPICLPYICSVFAAALSVNVCDPRHSSPAVVDCVKSLLHCFSIVIASCGMNVLPACPSIMTSFVYQLEWVSQVVRSQFSVNMLAFKLSVYRCISSMLDASALVASSVLLRLVPRIVSEVCSDISNIVNTIASQTTVSSQNSPYFSELGILCAVASIRIIEQLFVNQSFVLSKLTFQNSPYNKMLDDGNHHYTLKKLLLLLSSEFENLASRLVVLLSKTSRPTPIQRVLLRPQFLASFINAMAAVQDYGFLFSESNSIRELCRVLLKHDDATVRTYAERSFRHSFKHCVKKPLLSVEDSTSHKNRRVSSFSQTDQSFCSSVSISIETENVCLPVQPQELPQPLEGSSVHRPPNMTGNSSSPQKPVRKRSSSTEAPAPSKKICSDASLQRPDTEQIPTEQTVESDPHSLDVSNTCKSNGAPSSISDALSTFDDTLL